MRTRTRSATLICAGLSIFTAIGCASTDSIPVSEANRQLDEKQRELAAAEDALRDREQRIESLSKELADSRLPAVSAAPPRGMLAQGDGLLPPAAKPGECYARVFEPAVYKTRSIRKLKSDASERVEVVPAQYETVSERLIVKEPSQRIETIPPTYTYVAEKVLVKEASFRLEEVAATYSWQEESVLVRPAETVWKKGRGPIERVDDATGEIMCLVEVPAEYKTVRKRVLETPATTRRIQIPAVYETVKRRVLKTPATTRTVELPAEYRTVQVRKLRAPARERRVEIPAEYQDVTQQELLADGRMAWRPVLCETNATRETIVSIQRALWGAGHDPGPIDGVIGLQTLGALKSFQQEEDLPSGGLTYATIDKLGVKVGR